MYKKLKIESSINNLRIIENAIDEVVAELRIKQQDYGKILVSTLEAVNNAITHGNKSEREKMVDVEISYKNEKLKIKVTDQGIGFIPELVPDPTTPQNIESVNGRGIFLMSRLADEVKFSRKGNTVTMLFKNLKS
jgi:serine/threonine-protein kinase RsbW